MGKRRKGGKKRPEPSSPPAEPERFHNPFEGLEALRDQLPEGEQTGEAQERAPSPEAQEPPAPGAASASALGLGRTKLVVRREKKGRGGKTVTVVEGAADEVREPLATRLRRELGCGGWVEQEQIVLQGAQTDRVAEWLRAHGAHRLSVSR